MSCFAASLDGDNVMLSLLMAPILLGGLIVILLGVLGWGSLRRGRSQSDAWLPGADGNLLLGLALLGAIGLGVFALYVLFSGAM